jgi:cell division protein FtsZ
MHLPDSLVKNALASISTATGSEIQAQAPAQTLSPAETRADEELKRIAAQLDVTIKIMGCGGGGCNTVNRCMEEGISGAQLCAINTDAKHLLAVKSPTKILIGKTVTKGLGAGAIPDVGTRAAIENEMEIRHWLEGANIVFITAGMGGGTGTGSAHFVAEIAKDYAQALTIGVVTLPFKSEGTVRMENAMAGLDRLRRIADTTIVIPNDKLLDLVPNMPVQAAFKVADEVLMQTIKGLTEIITKPGLVNLDYADIRTLMNEGGVAFVGIGESDDEDDRVKKAVSEALSSPLLGDISVKECHGALVRIVGGPDMTVTEAQQAAEIVGKGISDRARIIWGCSIDPELAGTIKVLLILTGAKSKYVIGGDTQDVAARLGVPAARVGAGRAVQGKPMNKDEGVDFVH